MLRSDSLLSSPIDCDGCETIAIWQGPHPRTFITPPAIRATNGGVGQGSAPQFSRHFLNFGGCFVVIEPRYLVLEMKDVHSVVRDGPRSGRKE